MDILITIFNLIFGLITITLINFVAMPYVLSKVLKSDSLNPQKEASINLGIKQKDLFIEANSKRVIEYLTDRYSSDHFKNRLSDLFTSLIYIVIGFCILFQLICIPVIIWESFPSGVWKSSYLWGLSIFIISCLFSILSMYLLCKVITGRHPGEAKNTREFISQHIENQHTAKES